MKTFLRFSENFARFLGSFCLIALLFLTFMLEVFALPGLPDKSSLIDWNTIFILLIWLLILLLLYLFVTRSLIINLLLIPIIYLWGTMLFTQLYTQFKSSYTIMHILTSVIGVSVYLIGFIITIFRNRVVFFKWCVKKESLTVLSLFKQEI